MKKPSNLRFFSINLLLALILIAAMIAVTVYYLKKYTKHGQEFEVPQITGLYVQEAEYLLSSSNLLLEVVDSTFSQKVPLGTIVEQNPPAESHVKENRAIYVVVNANSKRQVVLPEVHDISFRQAENTLRQLGLNVAEIVYEPSEYRDLVLDVRLDEESLETGVKLTEGTQLVLVVGQGRGTDMVVVPDVSGLKVHEVRSLLLSQHLTLGVVEYDIEPTDENREEYMVYQQQPKSGMMILEGSSVKIKMSMDKEKAVTKNNMEDEEEFF